MTVGLDLGSCGALHTGSERCEGRLIVVQELGGIEEAECSACGCVAARPVRVAEPESEPVEQWWHK